MLKELVIKNRSYRSFSPDRKITKDEVLELIDSARLTPSAMNLQPLKYRVCISDEECDKVLPLTAWAGKLRPLVLPPKGHAPSAYIIVCTDTEVVKEPKDTWRDVGICAQTILLRASEMGLGGCMLGAFSAEKISEALDIDRRYIPTLIIALGEPDENIQLKELDGDDTSYYRTENGTHVVPKRKLEDVII
ncbi:MAG: nitroreductase [Ruminococcaceae bacterium]|nr:nitroreductase [Oscillospiraceae bacterium]